MSEQHESKAAGVESPKPAIPPSLLTPKAVNRTYRLAEECLAALCKVCDSARAVEETYQQADETNRRLFGHLMDEAAEKERRWQMDVGVPKVVGVLAELESPTTPEMEDAACKTVQGGESYGLIGSRENSALVAVKNGIALIVKDQNAVGVIGWQCEGLLNNAKELRLALNAERVRVTSALEKHTAALLARARKDGAAAEGGARQSGTTSAPGSQKEQHEPPPEGIWQALFRALWRLPPWLKWPIIILTGVVLILFALYMALPDATKQKGVDWIAKHF